jgi:hypothetical protein
MYHAHYFFTTDFNICQRILIRIAQSKNLPDWAKAGGKFLMLGE